MNDSEMASIGLQQSISNSAFNASEMIKTAIAPVQTNMAKSIINGLKPAWDTAAKAASRPFQDVLKQQQETVLRMFQAPENASIGMPESSFSLLKNRWHQLVILGNGFDLECGLHSKFIDFACPRLSIIDSNSGSVFKKTNQFVTNHDLTVWDLILYNEPQNNWSDIESAIERWITTRNTDVETSCAIIANILNNQKDGLVNTFLSSFSSDTAKTQKLVARFLRPLFETQHTWTASEVANILFSELNKLESAFSDYLCREVSRNENYAQSALDLLDRMLVTELPDEAYNDVTASLLDFNYTNPLIGVANPSKPYSGKRPFPTLVNIHGSLREKTSFSASMALSIWMNRSFFLLRKLTVFFPWIIQTRQNSYKRILRVVLKMIPPP